MSMVSVRYPYILSVVYDDDPINPREDYDNFGKMICWHRRYNLGDKHNYENPDEMLKELVSESTSSKDIIHYVKSGKSNKVKLQYNNSTREWEINSYWDGLNKWYIDDYTFPAPIQDNKLLADSLLDELRTNDLLVLAQKNNIILPLFLYDHSGISMSASTFIGRAQHAEWDSVQVGWIYASYKDIKKEYDDCAPGSIEKANKLLLSEVKLYDAYISGQSYGFQLYKNGSEIDSCWGFLGDIDDVKESIKEEIGDEYDDLVDKLDYTESTIDEIIMEEDEEYDV